MRQAASQWASTMPSRAGPDPSRMWSSRARQHPHHSRPHKGRCIEPPHYGRQCIANDCVGMGDQHSHRRAFVRARVLTVTALAPRRVLGQRLASASNGASLLSNSRGRPAAEPPSNGRGRCNLRQRSERRKPNSRARMTASVRLRTANARRTAAMCVRTVPSPMPSRQPISRFDVPSSIS